MSVTDSVVSPLCVSVVCLCYRQCCVSVCYRQCCVGTELVDWQMQQSSCVVSRVQAVGMWQALLEEGVLYHGEAHSLCVCVCSISIICICV